MTDTNQEVRETPEVDACEYVLVPRSTLATACQKMELSADIIRRNLSHQREKVEDARSICIEVSEAIRRAILQGVLASAPPPAVPDAVGVRVKRLDWEHNPLSAAHVQAASAFGVYRVVNYGDHARWGCAEKGTKIPNRAANMEAAKAAAQADFDRRILSSIEPTPSPEPQASNAGAALREIIARNQEREWTGDPVDGGVGWVVRDGQYAKISRAALSTPEPQTGERDGEVVDSAVVLHWWDKDRSVLEPLVRQSALLAERTAREAAERTRDSALDRADESDRLRVEAFMAHDDAERRLAEVEEWARGDGIRAAISLVEKLANEHARECGIYDYTTNVVEFDGAAEDVDIAYQDTLRELAALRAKPETQAIDGKEGDQ